MHNRYDITHRGCFFSILMLCIMCDLNSKTFIMAQNSIMDVLIKQCCVVVHTLNQCKNTHWKNKKVSNTFFQTNYFSRHEQSHLFTGFFFHVLLKYKQVPPGSKADNDLGQHVNGWGVREDPISTWGTSKCSEVSRLESKIENGLRIVLWWNLDYTAYVIIWRTYFKN